MENKEKLKIAIVGMGGVGGFIGAKLAAYYEKSTNEEIYFIARGKTRENIEARGIILDTADGQIIAHPHKVTNQPAEIGTVDFLLLCTKAYDLEQAICEAMPCIGAQTVVIPFLNGVDAASRIQKLLPKQEVWSGCVYIFAQVIEPGHITEDTRGYKYIYGPQNGADKQTQKTAERIARLDQLFERADIRAHHDEAIKTRVWNKFAYISTVATLTSATDRACNEIAQTPELMEQLRGLLSEFRAVAAAKRITLSENIDQNVIDQMCVLPAGTTTSMQRDFRAGRRTEIESLTGYILRQAQARKVATPLYTKFYQALIHKK